MKAQDITDILGLDRAAQRKIGPSLTDRDVWRCLEHDFPGLRDRLLDFRGPGQDMYIPADIEAPRARARALDDGVMGIRELARLAGVAYETARKARRERAA